jgi:hypothetical protein
MRQVDQLNQLSTEQLKDKIKQAEFDIKKMQGEGGLDRKVAVLIEYKDYLIDELKELENK